MDKNRAGAYLHPLRPLATEVEPNGRLEPPIKCLLCDIYGTLFISASGDIGTAQLPDHKTIQLDQLLDRYSLNHNSRDLLAQLNDTIKDLHAQARDQGIDFPEVVIETVWQKILRIEDMQRLRNFAIEFEMIMNPVWPMPGVSTLLDQCRAKGIALGIISNAQFFTPYLFEWLLRASQIELGFDPELVWYSFDFGIAKPSPKLFQMARHQLQSRGIKDREVAFIGNDMRNDILPAHRAGFQTVLFAGDARSLRLRESDPACREIVPDMVARDLKQIIPLIQ